MLNQYLTDTESLISDYTNQFWKQANLVTYINRARGQVAAEGQCVRLLTPGTNGIASIAVDAGGSGYLSAPTVTITGPGSGGTAHSVLTGDAVSSVVVDTAGSGYDNTTTISFSGGSGAGAAAHAVINCLNTVANQEAYTFSAANAFVQLTAGVDSIITLESVAVSWGALKPTLDQWNFNDFQALVRAYPITSGQPSIWAQLGQGGGGSIYLRPVPTQALPMEWVCICKPLDLASDSDAEAIPFPWTDAVPYFATFLALMNARRPMEAKNVLSLYSTMMLRARAFSESTSVPSYYQ